MPTTLVVRASLNQVVSNNKLHSFSDLASIVQATHDAAQSSAVKSINRMQTMRNWLIGYYIVEFEQYGKDRAEYGTQLLKKLEERVNRKGLNVTLFQSSRNFYNLYPQMVRLFVPNEIYSTLSNKSENHVFVKEKSIDGQVNTICATVSHKFRTPPEVIVSRLSFSHIREIMSVNDPLAKSADLKCRRRHGRPRPCEKGPTKWEG